MPQKLRRLQPALKLIAEAYSSPITVPQMAEACSTSPVNFWRMFREGLGVAPQRYMHLVRIQHAASELRSGDLSVRQIGEKVGFATLSSFNRTFRLITGTTPQQWRRDPL